MNEIEEAKKISKEVGEYSKIVSEGQPRPYPTIPGGFARKGFKKDIDSVCKLVDIAHSRGATNEQCDKIAAWLEGVIPFYLKKHKLKDSGGAISVSLKTRELARALRIEIDNVAGVIV